MKKALIIGSLVVVGILIFGAVGVASAQTLLPRIFGSRSMSDWESRSSMMNSQGTGTGMMGGGRGSRGMMGSQIDSGILHDYMLAGFAAAFDMEVADLQARLDAGETMYDVAVSLNYTQEQFTELMTTVRTDAINQALADGVITQEQADWMLTRLSQRGQGGFGTGTCTGDCQLGGRGGRAGGMGMSRGSQTGCPLTETTQP
jgi:hypothetical protein